MNLENERDFKGIWIPANIWLSTELSLQEKVVLVEINSLDGKNGCFATNDHFADFFGYSKRRIIDIINSLEKKGYIIKKNYYKGKSAIVEKRIIRCTNKYSMSEENCTQMSEENCTQMSEENCTGNNTINNTINNKKKKKTEIDELIEGYTKNESLKENLYEFIKMRKGIKAAITTLGLKRILNRLDSLATNDQDKIKILDNSIMNSWKGVFALKENVTTPVIQNYQSQDVDNFEIDESKLGEL